MRMTAAEVIQLSARLEAVMTEHQVCRQKLASKCEALLILSRELSGCRSERDQFKLMAEQLRERYQVLKRQLAGHRPVSPTQEWAGCVDLKDYATAQGQGLAQVLMEYRDQNKSLKFEVDDLKQRLNDAQGDIKLLREQIVRSRVGTTDEGMTTRHFPAYEREDLVRQLEAAREQVSQLERDLHQVCDEKQELVSERDAFRHKHARLNTHLNHILHADTRATLDIDAVLMENKFLHERIKQMEVEKNMAMDTVAKYKSILEKRKNKGILKVGQNRSGGLIISQKQVRQLVESEAVIAPSPKATADLQALCSALLDAVNDKTLALAHQRKTNKILGGRVSELEKKLRTLEVAGLWGVSEHLGSLQKLRAECSDVKRLVPSPASDASDPRDSRDLLSDLDSDSLTHTPSSTPAHSPTKTLNALGLDADLDLLPSREEVTKHVGEMVAVTTMDAPFSSGSDLPVDTLPVLSNRGDASSPTVKTPAYHSANHNPDNNPDHNSDDDERQGLLGDGADRETVDRLHGFLSTATQKLMDKSLATHRPDAALLPPATQSPLCATSSDLLSSPLPRQPLLQEMSQPTQEHDSDETFVQC